jgi:hypothetical protein
MPEVRRISGLPCSAWLYRRSGSEELILAGPGVEETGSGIFEGCWSGPYSAGGFAEAENVFGSGIAVSGGARVFVPPTHVQNQLFIWLEGGSETVSNSLTFLLEFHGIDLPLADWGRRFFRAARGIDADYRELFRSGRGQLLRVIYDRFELRDGQVVTHRPSPGPAFEDFAQYRDYLGGQVGLAIANGRDGRRRRPLRAVAMVSSGYDSVAAMALGHRFGLDAILTFGSSRDGESDSGRGPAGDLGLSVVEREFERGSAGLEVEAEFLASGSGGDDIHIAAFAAELKDAMILNGFGGDAIWSPWARPSTGLPKRDRAGASMAELCLRVGAVPITVPLIGGRRHPEIRRISRSSEMDPWRLGGSYDRPIPRRIAEEAGVRRESFGQKKRATSQSIAVSSTFLSRRSREDFRAREREIVGRGWLRHRARGIWHDLRFETWRASGRLIGEKLRQRRLHRLIEFLLVRDNWSILYNHPRYSDALFLWAVGHHRKVYRRALDGQEAPGDAAAVRYPEPVAQHALAAEPAPPPWVGRA